MSSRQCNENGIVLQGTLRISTRHWETAFVSAPDPTEPDILIAGVRDRNRGLDGDEVIVEILPKALWVVVDEKVQVGPVIPASRGMKSQRGAHHCSCMVLNKSAFVKDYLEANNLSLPGDSPSTKADGEQHIATNRISDVSVAGEGVLAADEERGSDVDVLVEKIEDVVLTEEDAGGVGKEAGPTGKKSRRGKRGKKKLQVRDIRSCLEAIDQWMIRRWLQSQLRIAFRPTLAEPAMLPSLPLDLPLLWTRMSASTWPRWMKVEKSLAIRSIMSRSKQTRKVAIRRREEPRKDKRTPRKETHKRQWQMRGLINEGQKDLTTEKRGSTTVRRKAPR